MPPTLLEKLKAEQDRMKKDLALLKWEAGNLRKALSRKEGYLDALPTGFMVIQGERIQEVNGVLLRHLGYSAEEILTRDLREFMPGGMQTSLRGIFGKGRSEGASEPEEIELIGKDGTVHSWDLKAQKMRLPGGPSFVLMLVPNEERKRKERLLVGSVKELALHTMASGLSDVLSHAVQSYRQRSAFPKEPPAPEQEQPMQGVEEMVLSLEDMAGALECVARKNPDPFRKVPFDLKKVLREALAAANRRFREGAEKQGTDIKVKTYLRSVSPLEGDPDEIRHMLSEVIMNGLEAMPRGGALYISTEEHAGFATIFVQDNGNGVSGAYRERLLDPFFTTKGKGKRGLGLSLSQAIVQRHHGELEISSKESEGTTVAIRLPLAKPEGGGRKRPRQKKGIKNTCILIIEEAPLIGELLLQTLRSKGCKVDMAATAAEGLAQVRRKAFDLVVVGAALTGVKGERLARRIKESMASLPVALIKESDSTASADQEHPTLADLVIRKPIDLTQVVEGITRILNASRRP